MAMISMSEALRLLAAVEAQEFALSDPYLQGSFNEPWWLLLPTAKRAVTVKRLEALTAYDELREPTSKQAAEAAEKLGLGLRRFYDLLSNWRENDRSPHVLVPYQALSGVRKSRLSDQAVAGSLRAIIDDFLAERPTAPPSAVIRHVRDEWDRPEKLPSDVTIRNFLERALQERRAAPGTLTISLTGAVEDETTASRFGEVIVIDHTAPSDLILAYEDGAAPTITLAIDLWSGAPIGAVATDDYPAAEAVVLALENAADRVYDLGDGEHAVKPRIVLASTFDSGWTELREALLDEGYDLIERRDSTLHHGGLTKRIIGPTLGELQLQPKAASRREARGQEVDLEKTAILPLEQVQQILDMIVDDAFDELVPDTVLAGLPAIDLTAVRSMLRRPVMPEYTGIPIRLDMDRCDGLDDVGAERSVTPFDMTPDKLIGIVRRMLGKSVGDASAKREQSGGWHVSVQVADPAARTPTWLALAREALRLYDEEGIFVRIDVELSPAKASERMV